MELATSSHSVTVKGEPVVKREPEWGDAAARADLYEDHEIKEELAFSPELLQQQDIARSRQMRIYFELEQQMDIKEEPCDHGPRGNDNSDVPLSNAVPVKEERYPSKLEPPDEVKREPECLFTCPWDVNHSMSFAHQFNLRSCFVRLERIPMEDHLTCPMTPTVDSNPKDTHPQKTVFCKPIEKLMAGKSKSHICSFCDKLFAKKSDYTRHVRIHTGEKPYTCDVCAKRFTDHSRLARHIRIHSREAQHCCEVCHTQFVQKADFDKHLLSHMGDKPHCQKVFVRRTNFSDVSLV